MKGRKTKSSKPAKPAKDGASRSGKSTKKTTYNLRLYVAGQTPKSMAAFANLKRHCDELLPGRYHLEVIDLVQQPQLAAGDQIFALPTLVRKLPPPLKRIIGNLSDREKFLVGLDLKQQ